MATQTAATPPRSAHAPSTAAKSESCASASSRRANHRRTPGSISREHLHRLVEQATFAVPSEALPKEWLLFELTPRLCRAFRRRHGRPHRRGQRSHRLAQLKQRPGSPSRDAWFSARRAVARQDLLGDLTILFQFVTPPPPQPRPRLPASVRGSWTPGWTGPSPWSRACPSWRT